MMIFGREVVLPLQTIMGKPVPEESVSLEVEDHVSKLQTSMTKIYDVARTNLSKAAEYQKRYYDTHSKKAQQRHFETGQLVWLHEVGVCNKLMNKWKGPYRVTRKIDDLIYNGKEDSKSACQSLPY